MCIAHINRPTACRQEIKCKIHISATSCVGSTRRSSDIVTVMNRPQRDEVLIKEAGIPLDRALFPLLLGIERFGPIGVVEIADRVGRDYTTVSRQVAKLESLGLVERRASPADRRVREAAISPKGQGDDRAGRRRSRQDRPAPSSRPGTRTRWTSWSGLCASSPTPCWRSRRRARRRQPTLLSRPARSTPARASPPSSARGRQAETPPPSLRAGSAPLASSAATMSILSNMAAVISGVRSLPVGPSTAAPWGEQQRDDRRLAFEADAHQRRLSLVVD